MSDTLLELIRTGESEVLPRFKALQAINGALKQAARLASQEKLDALPMQKALVKFDTALAAAEEQGLASDEIRAAHASFASATQTALDALAYEFARDLKDLFESQGEPVSGRPPTLVVGELVLQIDANARKATWFYGKEPLTKPLALSLNAITKAYDQQRKRIVEREIDPNAFLQEMYTAWQDRIAERKSRPRGGRINIISVYSQLILNRQNNRFWNQPSRSTFRDYERPLFVRDLVLTRDAGTTLIVDGQERRMGMGTATKSQTDQAHRSIWIPISPLDGEYYSDVTFDDE